ncbi:MAG TPA: hypothetical protein VIU62_09140 [Chloroflexota bacterium]
MAAPGAPLPVTPALLQAPLHGQTLELVLPIATPGEDFLVRLQPVSDGGKVVGVLASGVLASIEEEAQRLEQLIGALLPLAPAEAETLRIVAAHQGEIGVESTPGLGTTFTVRLPAGQPLLRTGSATLPGAPAGGESTAW